jgi:adenosylcobinamide-phosphate synthase
MVELFIVIVLGFILDLIIGDPHYRYHPVRIMGGGIVFFEKILRRFRLDGLGGGILLVLIVEIISLSGYILIRVILYLIHPIPALCFDIFVCYSCLAIKDLMDHMKPVIHGLESNNLSEAREAIAKVVGRDVRYLDEEGVGRAAVETMAENFVDGFFSPLFWFLAGGILGYILGLSPVMPALGLMIASKVGSTLDSMVGHKSPEYAEFGKAGARLDDLVNFVPARLSLIILFFGAWLSGLHPVSGLRVALKDRMKHDSPNAAHAESFVAGALNIRLGGPTVYQDGLKDKPWLGEGYADPTMEQIYRTAMLIKVSSWVSMAVTFIILLLIYS